MTIINLRDFYYWYSYIVATHTDKGHIHNHILFCAADNIDYKKYHDCKRTYWDIRHLNDELCEAHNLSVIRENKYKAKKYKEWLSDKSGTSWKSQLKSDINETIKLAHSYEEFLSLMQAKGYQIKDSEISPEAHKYIVFRLIRYDSMIYTIYIFFFFLFSLFLYLRFIIVCRIFQRTIIQRTVFV